MVVFDAVRLMIQDIQNDPNILLKVVGITAVINAIFASFMHKSGKLTIYVDYTDAAMTASIPFIVIALLMIFHVLQWPHIAGVFIPLVAGIITLFVLINTWRENKNPFWFLVSFLAKFTVLLVFLFFFFSAGGRKEGESKRSAERRAAIERAAAVAGYTAWSVWVTRTPSFSPVKTWFIR